MRFVCAPLTILALAMLPMALLLSSAGTAEAETEVGHRMQKLFMATCFEAAKSSDMSIAATLAQDMGYKLLGTIHPTGSMRKGYRAYSKSKGGEEIWIGATKATQQSCGVTFSRAGDTRENLPHFLYTISMATKGKPWGKGFVTTHWVTHSFNDTRYEFAVVPGKDRTGYFVNFK